MVIALFLTVQTSSNFLKQILCWNDNFRVDCDRMLLGLVKTLWLFDGGRNKFKYRLSFVGTFAAKFADWHQAYLWHAKMQFINVLPTRCSDGILPGYLRYMQTQFIDLLVTRCSDRTLLARLSATCADRQHVRCECSDRTLSG